MAATNQKLVSFMGGFGLVGGAEGGLSGLAETSEGGRASSMGGDSILRGETGVWERIGLRPAGAGLGEEAEGRLRCDGPEDPGVDDDGDDGEGERGEAEEAGPEEKEEGVLSPRRASRSGNPARLRRDPSPPGPTSVPLASS